MLPNGRCLRELPTCDRRSSLCRRSSTCLVLLARTRSSFCLTTLSRTSGERLSVLLLTPRTHRTGLTLAGSALAIERFQNLLNIDVTNRAEVICATLSVSPVRSCLQLVSMHAGEPSVQNARVPAELPAIESLRAQHSALLSGGPVELTAALCARRTTLVASQLTPRMSDYDNEDTVVYKIVVKLSVSEAGAALVDPLVSGRLRAVIAAALESTTGNVVEMWYVGVTSDAKRRQDEHLRDREQVVDQAIHLAHRRKLEGAVHFVELFDVSDIAAAAAMCSLPLMVVALHAEGLGFALVDGVADGASLNVGRCGRHYGQLWQLLAAAAQLGARQLGLLCPELPYDACLTLVKAALPAWSCLGVVELRTLRLYYGLSPDLSIGVVHSALVSAGACFRLHRRSFV